MINATGGNRPPTGGLEAQLASVHTELTAVFAGVSSYQPSPSASKGPGSGDSRARSRNLRAVAVVAIVLLVAGTVAILASSRRPSTPIAATTPAIAVRTPTVKPAAPPVSSARATSAAPSNIDIPAPPPLPVEPVAATAPSERATTRVAVVDKVRKPATTGHKRGTAAVASAAEPRDDHPRNVAPECSGRYESWCLREVTAAADRDLRAAYGAAVQSKVDRGTLRRIRREWVRYRHLANKRPRDLIRGFAELTVDLRESASHNHR